MKGMICVLYSLPHLLHWTLLLHGTRKHCGRMIYAYLEIAAEDQVECLHKVYSFAISTRADTT